MFNQPFHVLLHGGLTIIRVAMSDGKVRSSTESLPFAAANFNQKKHRFVWGMGKIGRMGYDMTIYDL